MNITKILRKKWRLLNREEQASVIQMFACKLFNEVHGAAYQLKHLKLRRQSKKMLSAKRDKRPANVFVFANGPSLKSLDFTKIKKLTDSGDFDLISVNSFASSAMKTYGVRPTFGVFNDPIHYSSDEDPNRSKYLWDQAQEDIDVMNENGIPALVPYRYFKRSRFDTSIPYSGFRNIYSKNVSDVNKPVGFYGLTAFYALALALDLDYCNVYICGYDNSYFKSFECGEDNKKYFEDKHFYDDSVVEKRYLPSEEYGPTSHIFYNVYRHFKYLEKISRHGKQDVKIYNIAKETYTDAFPRCFDLDIYT